MRTIVRRPASEGKLTFLMGNAPESNQAKHRSPAFAFGKVQKRMRTELGMTQEELSVCTQLDRSYLSLLERGIRQPSLNTIILLAEAFGIQPSELVALVMEEMRDHR